MPIGGYVVAPGVGSFKDPPGVIQLTSLDGSETALVDNGGALLAEVTTALIASLAFTPSTGAAVTAHAGGGQANATPLTYGLNLIGTVATVGDSVLFPPAVIGALPVITANNTVNAAQAFGTGTNTINNAASGTGVPLNPGALGIYVVIAAGQWFGGSLS